MVSQVGRKRPNEAREVRTHTQPLPAPDRGTGLRRRRPSTYSGRGKRAAKPNVLNSESILNLQRHVGNTIVTTLIELASASARGLGATVQRAPLPAADDPHGYTQPQGVQDVVKTGLTRLEVHGLKFGVSGGFQNEYGKRTSAGRSIPSFCAKACESFAVTSRSGWSATAAPSRRSYFREASKRSPNNTQCSPSKRPSCICSTGKKSFGPVLIRIAGRSMGRERPLMLAACFMMLARDRSLPHCLSTYTRVWATV